MTRTHVGLVAGVFVCAAAVGFTQSGTDRLTADTFKALEFRSIGPTISSGRIADITVDPNHPNVYYVASAVGGLWKSENRGNTWTSVFDSGGSFNMCCVVVDPKNSDVLWLGTGENSNPRSSTYGDGLYKSTDAGKSWTRVGLATSEHIGKILLDPRNSDVVYVAAQGPLWSAGGDRGVFKTTDGGKTWKAVLTVGSGQDTGANDLAIDPNNPEVLYASMWQRRRAPGQMIGGGPESGIYKSINGGLAWTKLAKGLPAGDLGRIAIGVDPKAKPTRVYALINGAAGDSGFFRSNDAGVTFDRMGAPYGKPAEPAPAAAAAPRAGAAGAGAAGAAGGGAAGAGAAGAGAAGAAGAARGGGAGGGGGRGGCAPGAYCGGDPGYYQEIFVDPIRPDTIWSANTNLEWSQDGGKSWSNVPNMNGVHVDYHVVWADPKDRVHLMVGNDGGAYESWDDGKTWRHFNNMPVTQFYRIAVDDALPFYNVCGGAQDNESQCGPSRTMNRVGIRMSDWWMTGGCDGFQSRIEPGNPNIVYTTCQSGGVSRMDLRTGESKSVRPGGANVLPDPNAPPAAPAGAAAGAGRGGRAGGGGRGGGGGERTNWDAPYIISPHSPTRLYFGSSRLYRSDDRGDHWMAVSPDLTRNLDARTIPIMGKVWDPATTVAYNNATTVLSTIVSVDESPLTEGLIYVGSDDGVLSVTEDGGKTWRRTEQFAGVPDGVWLTDVFPSPRDSNVVFVTLNNWQRGDFKPYIVRSDDRGKTFKSIVGNFPDRMDVYSIIQDHVNGNLLFAGAEFGLFFTVDGGAHWVQLKGGLPTVQIRDMAVQKRESDLVLGTFGRSAYVLDDYSPLRDVTAEALSHEAELFSLRHAYAYDDLGYVQSAWGNTTTRNPPIGAPITYFVAPNFSGNLVLNVADGAGKTLCRIDAPERPGVDRVNWNLRVQPVPDPNAGGGRGGGGGGGGGRGRGNAGPMCMEVQTAAPAAPAGGDATAAGGAGAGGAGAQGAPAGAGAGGFGGRGGTPPLVPAGHYVVTLGRLEGDKFTPIGKPQWFQVLPLPAKNW